MRAAEWETVREWGRTGYTESVNLQFEWDENKAEQNIDKHGVAFAEAATIFGDPLSLTIPDPLHSIDEERFLTLGESANGDLLVVAHTDRQGSIRIISA